MLHIVRPAAAADSTGQPIGDTDSSRLRQSPAAPAAVRCPVMAPHCSLNSAAYMLDGCEASYTGGISIGYWSDKLAVTPYREYLTIGRQGTWQRLAARLLTESFGIAGRSAEETSRMISESVRGGVSLYGAASVAPFTVPICGIRTGMRTILTTRIDFPEAPFLIFFSEDNGLRLGTDLPLTHLGMQACIVTEVSASRRLIVALPSIIPEVNGFIRTIADFDSCVFDYGVTAAFGHLFFEVSTISGGVHLKDDDATRLYADASFLLQASGVGVRRTELFALSSSGGFPVTGAGAGFDAAMTLYGKRAFFTAGVHDIGPMVWFAMRKAETTLRTADLSIDKLLFDDKFDLFADGDGDVSASIDTGEITRSAPPLIRGLPASVVTGIGYRFELFGKLVDHVLAAFIHNRQIMPWTGTTPSGEYSLIASTVFSGGIIPCSIGWTFGGVRGPASSLLTGFTVRKVSVCTGYSAAGSPIFFPKRGCTLYLGIIAGAVPAGY